jgi:hypothetical protein
MVEATIWAGLTRPEQRLLIKLFSCDSTRNEEPAAVEGLCARGLLQENHEAFEGGFVRSNARNAQAAGGPEIEKMVLPLKSSVGRISPQLQSSVRSSSRDLLGDERAKRATQMKAKAESAKQRCEHDPDDVELCDPSHHYSSEKMLCEPRRRRGRCTAGMVPEVSAGVRH